MAPRLLSIALLPVLAAAAPAPEPNRGLDPVQQPVVGPLGAIVPTCPDWSDAGRESREATSRNFGCATNSALAAMIADPADLLRGQPYPGTNAMQASRAIKAWREAPITSKNGLEKVSAKGGSQ